MATLSERRLTVRKGINFGRPNWMRIKPTDYELAIHALPGLRFWLSYETRFEGLGSLKGLRERRTKTDILPFDAAAAYGLGFSINNRPTLNLVSAAGVQRGLVVTGAALAALDFGYMVTGYTRVFVVNKVSDALQMPLGAFNNGGGILYLRGTTGFPGRLDLIQGGASVYTSGLTSPGFNGSPVVILQSWDASTKLVTMEVNGTPRALTANTLNAPTPLAATKFAIGGWDEEGSSFANGTLGDSFIFDRSLARTENVGIKDVLYRQLAQYYGITIALPTA